MKMLMKFLFVLIVLTLILFLTRNLILQFAVEKGVEAATGLPLSMKSMDLSFSQTSLKIEEMRIFNPAGFSDSIMVDMPLIFVDFNLTNILKGKIHLEAIKIYLQEFSVVRSADGRLNINSIKTVKAAEKPKAAEKKPEAPKEKARALPIQMDLVELKADLVTFKEFRGGQPTVREFKINLNERYRNITNMQELVNLIILRVMTKTPLAALTGFDLSGIQSEVSKTLVSATELASDSIVFAKDTLNETMAIPGTVVGTGQQTVKEFTGGVTETTKGLFRGVKSETSILKDKFKSPFSRTPDSQ